MKINFEKKAITGIGLGLTLFCCMGIAFTYNSDFFNIKKSASAVCSHHGNHYSLVETTLTTSGNREFWTCCECHEHFFTKPSGTWTDSGVPTFNIPSGDDRYLAPCHLSNGIVLSADGTKITEYIPMEGITDIVIPEGVTYFSNVFAGSNITSIVIPGTVQKVDGEAFLRCKQLKHATIKPGVERLLSVSTDHGLFTYCSALEWVVIPDTVYECEHYLCKEASDTSKCTIYCEVNSFPGKTGKNKYGNKNNWDTLWAVRSGLDKYGIVWGLNVNWHYDTDGITPIKN